MLHLFFSSQHAWLDWLTDGGSVQKTSRGRRRRDHRMIANLVSIDFCRFSAHDSWECFACRHPAVSQSPCRLWSANFCPASTCIWSPCSGNMASLCFTTLPASIGHSWLHPWWWFSSPTYMGTGAENLCTKNVARVRDGLIYSNRIFFPDFKRRFR